MKPIIKIAKAELKAFFYSPIAWLILVIFSLQSALVFSESFGDFVRAQSLGAKLDNLTLRIFYRNQGMDGAFLKVQRYIYLYIPLLTMGVMSREFSSGSIKLLFSSPLSNTQIVLGKYLSLVIYALALTGVLGIFALYGTFSISHADIFVLLIGLLGLFLLICTYSAIGLFMSSLTSYTVVAAMGTLGIFALLNYVKGVGQEIEIVRDVTYWLAISERSNSFVSGLITTENLLYFLSVITLFICFTLIKLNADRQKKSWAVTFGKYAGVFLLVSMVGYFSSKPSLKVFFDISRTKINTLTKSSQDVISKLDGDLTITTYTNMLDKDYWLALPEYYKYDVDRFIQYQQFKPEIKLLYKYYYHDTDNKWLDKQYSNLNAKQRFDTLRRIHNWKFKIDSYKEMNAKDDLSKEEFHFVRSLESSNGRQTFLRVFDDQLILPSEAEITAAFKRIAMELPKVGIMTGHGERASNSQEDRGYKTFAQERSYRYSLINQGFNFEDVTLEQEIPSDIRILVIAEMKKELNETETNYLVNYIERGGNLIIAGEPGRQAYMNPLTDNLGIRFLPGMLVKIGTTNHPSLLFLKPTEEGTKFSYHLKDMMERDRILTMPTGGGLEITADKGFDVKTLFTSDSAGSWNELETTNFVDDTVLLNVNAGEVEKAVPTVVALSRKINDKQQKILITGDADWLSNAELGIRRKGIDASNSSLINAAFFWMSDEEVPIDMRRDPTPDTSLKVGEDGWAISAIFLKWVVPFILTGIGLIIWIRRRGR